MKKAVKSKEGSGVFIGKNRAYTNFKKIYKKGVNDEKAYFISIKCGILGSLYGNGEKG